MTQAVLEVPEDQAEGKIKQYYEDIESVLRVPFVSASLRAIAVHRDYFLLAWPALKPNAQTLFFEQMADQIRALAVDAVEPATEQCIITLPSESEPVVHVLHYALPKVFFAVAALRWATTGQQPVLDVLPRAAKRQLVAGVPDGMHWPALSADLQTSESNEVWKDEAESFLGTPGLSGEYSALWQWAQPLQAAWGSWWEYVRRAGPQLIPRALRAIAESGVTSLPYRMDISPHTLRHAGLSESQIDAIRLTLDEQYLRLVRQVAWLAFLSVSVDGRERARVSAFPFQTL